jgi:hypothetical protein
LTFFLILVWLACLAGTDVAVQFGGQEPGTDEEIKETVRQDLVRVLVPFPAACAAGHSTERGAEGDVPALLEDQSERERRASGVQGTHWRSQSPLSAADPARAQFLKMKLKGTFGDSVKWNFTKFLCDRDGIPIRRAGPPTKPLELAAVLLHRAAALPCSLIRAHRTSSSCSRSPLRPGERRATGTPLEAARQRARRCGRAA